MKLEPKSQSEGALAVIYCRVSNVKQTTRGDGLGSQETRCREYARYRGAFVAEVFRDDVSGGKAERPGMDQMLEFLRKHRDKNPLVIIDDVSRLARGIQAHWDLRELIGSAGGSLISPSIEFGEDSDSKLVENIRASVAQHQREKNAEQTKHRMRARVQNGYWVFWAPKGYKFASQKGGGRIMVRDEPLASIIAEGLEGFAAGRFETQAELIRFFERQPEFPKDLPGGRIRNQRIKDMLLQPLYAGYIELPKWDVSLREAQHEGLISFATFKRIQERLNTKPRAPTKANLSADFPLRGFVLCGDCSQPMTACWSKGKSGKKHAYYQCFTKGCPSSRKSVRRDQMESEFEAIVRELQPSEALCKIAFKMFKKIWDHRLAILGDLIADTRKQAERVDSQIAGLMDRIVDASSDAVVAAYEKRITALEAEKAALTEKAKDMGQKPPPFEEVFQTPLAFLANPLKLWTSGDLNQRRILMKLAFSERPSYKRGEGFRTPNIALPFKALANFCGEKCEMARRGGFEPPTPRFVVWCSIQLSYRRRASQPGGPAAKRRGT